MFDDRDGGEWAVPGVSRGLGTDSGPASGAAVQPSPAVQALLRSFETIVDRNAADLPGPVALADTAALLALGERLRAVTLTHLADVELRRLHTTDGTPTTSAWVARQQISLPAGEVALARRLSVLPCVDAAVRSGRLAVAAAALVATALVKAKRHLDRPDGLIDGQDGQQVLQAVLVDGIPQLICQALGGLADDDNRLTTLTGRLQTLSASTTSQLARLAEGLVLLAEHLEPAQLRGALTQLLDALLPCELERRADDQHARRSFGLRQHADGSGWYISAGELDCETGELLHTVLTAELAVDDDNPVDTTGYGNARENGWTSADGHDALPNSTPTDPPTCPGPRSLTQRRHDALRNGLRRYLSTGIGGLRGKTVPQINVTISLASLHGEPGSLGPVGGSGTVLPRSLVQRWWCDSAVTRFIMSAGRKVIQTSHTVRTLKSHERQAKTIETGGYCQGTGCTRGPGHTIIPHHADPWATSHTTSLDDTVGLCEHDHHQLHTGHTLRLKDGRWLNQHGWTDGPR